MQRLALAACVLVCVCHLGASIKLVSTPDKIQPGITTSLKLRCEATSNTQIKLISSLALYFTPNPTSGTAGNSTSQPARQSLVTLMPGFPKNKNPSFNGTVTEGKIDRQTQNSVLEITTTDLTPGKYSCVVSGYSPTFTPATETDEVDVTNKPSLSPDQLSKDLNVKLQNMEKEVNSLKQRWSAIDSNAIFHKSSTYKASKYLLSKTRQQNVNLCQFMCTVHGGYLAEVDDEEEMNFLRDFIRPLLVNDNEYPDVFIGATDHGHKGVFKFMQNENKPVYTNWGGFPSNGYDCLILAKNSDYLMNDYDCNEATRFLCEIPN